MNTFKVKNTDFIHLNRPILMVNFLENFPQKKKKNYTELHSEK